MSCGERTRWAYRAKASARWGGTVASKLRNRKAHIVAESPASAGEAATDQGRLWSGVDGYFARTGTCSKSAALDDVFADRHADLDAARWMQVWGDPCGIPTTDDIAPLVIREHTKTLLPPMKARIGAWAALWGLPGLERRVDVRFSDRLHTSLGRCVPSRGLVRMNRRLLELQPRLLEEVLCHELAHVAVFERYGHLCRPHGPEWAALMRAAGFTPRVRARLGHDVERVVAPEPKRRPLYEHRCPVCQAARLACRRVPQWRCAACLRAGLDGRLVIEKRVGASA
jgi:predicted SprT family Zn-dependent metalloprotease